MKFFSQTLAALLLWNCIACNGDKKFETKPDMVASADIRVEDIVETVDSAYDKVEYKQIPIGTKSDPGSTGIDWDKKIIKNGSVVVEVKDYNKFNATLRATVKKLGGYIANEEQSQSDYKIENAVVIKVPVDQFEEGISDLTAAADKIMQRKINSQDVTTEIVDTKSRMEARKKVRDRYIELLKQAKNMSEVLQVQNEINNTQVEVEGAAGRIAYLGHSSAYSTININFYQVLNQSAGEYNEPSYGSRILTSFSGGVHWFAELFIIIVSLWPLWLGLVFIWLFIRKLKPAHLKKQ
jgi:hypothetical protein